MIRAWVRTGVPAGGAVVALLLAGPASAHVEVSADKPTAGATDSVLAFVAEAESRTSGISALRVILPEGIASADVTLVSGPSGWTLTRDPAGYAVSGQPLPAGQDARYSVRIRQLPTGSSQLVFKTLQNYRDGRVDRWIEEPTPGGQPENPAPVLMLAAPSPGTTPASPSPSVSVPVIRESSPAAPVQDQQETGTPPWAWLLLVIVGGAAAGGLWWLWRRRH